MTTNTCLNRIRAAGSRPATVPLDGEWEHLEATTLEGDPEHRAMVAWDRERLELALGELPPEYRMVIVLRHQEEMSYEEIAQAMRLPLGTVKTYPFRARRALRAAMEGARAPSGRHAVAPSQAEEVWQ